MNEWLLAGTTSSCVGHTNVRRVTGTNRKGLYRHKPASDSLVRAIGMISRPKGERRRGGLDGYEPGRGRGYNQHLMTQTLTPKPSDKFTFGLWTVGNRGRD